MVRTADQRADAVQEGHKREEAERRVAELLAELERRRSSGDGAP
jgi:hypothetical protein